MLQLVIIQAFAVLALYKLNLHNLTFLSVDQDLEFELGHVKHFTFHDLQSATDNFNSRNILGQGGFGIVYKGCLRNGTLVAVKRLKDPDVTGEVQFQTEVELIGLAVHRNLLRLYGFCMTSKERLLVYPYMPNGSVADRLRGNSLVYNISMLMKSTIGILCKSFAFLVNILFNIMCFGWFFATTIYSAYISLYLCNIRGCNFQIIAMENHLLIGVNACGLLLALPGGYSTFMNNAILRSSTGTSKLQTYCSMEISKQSSGILDW